MDESIWHINLNVNDRKLYSLSDFFEVVALFSNIRGSSNSHSQYQPFSM